MSGIFSLVNESSIPANVFANTYSRERYVESSIDLLTKTNSVINEQVKMLYSKILEADSVESENVAMKDFIQEIQAELDKLSFDIKTSSQRFAIALSNHCSSVKDQIDSIGTKDLSKCCYRGEYVKYDKARMLNSDAPQMNPYKIFEREFNFIGQLMQDLPVTASNKDKLEIVSTVYKNFKKSMDNNIVEKTYQDLFGLNSTDVKCTGSAQSIGRLVCGMFKSSAEDDHNICIDEYTDAVECISSCDEFIDCIDQTSTHLINDLKHIISDLNDILMGDSKNKFKVDTTEDGIRNTSYSIDKYTSNKIMWLIQEKVKQITVVFNKYILALSVKMECILGYMRQSADIVNSFTYMSCKAPKIDSEDKTNTEEDEVSDDKDNTEESDSDSDLDDDINKDEEVSEEEEQESKEDNALDGGDDILTKEDETENDVESTEDEDDSEIEEVSGDEEPEVDFEPEANEGDSLKEAVLDVITSIHEYNMICDQISLFEYAATLIMEEEANSDDKKKAPEVIGKLAAEKQSVWQKIVQKILKMWESFKEAIDKTYIIKISNLKKAGIEEYVKQKPVDVKIKMPTIDEKKIIIDLKEFDYDNMKDYLGSKEEFIKKFYSELTPKKDGDSISKTLEDIVIKRESLLTEGSQLDIKAYWEFVSKYPSYIDELKTSTQIIEHAQRKTLDYLKRDAKRAANESYTLEQMYFNETDFDGNPDKNDDGNKPGESKDNNTKDNNGDYTKKAGVYFSVNGDILHAMITTSQKVFNEFYAACMWHCNKMKEKKSSSSGDNSGKEAQPGNDKVVKFD